MSPAMVVPRVPRSTPWYWTWPAGALTGALLAAGSFYGLAVRPCQAAVEDADEVIAVALRQSEASSEGFTALADDDLAGLMLATAAMEEQIEPMREAVEDYEEQKERCGR